jgi:DNA-binding transcriptional ArsR family regulator
MPALPPNAPYDLAAFGELVSDPSRAAMLLSLLDGLARPASELAAIAGVAPSTASAHLARLTEGQLVEVEQRGRHRYYRLAGEPVADALEAIARPRATPVRPPTDPTRLAFGRARTCYRHLAGKLGVAWLDALARQKLVRLDGGALVLAPRAARRFEALGIAVDAWPAGKGCLDWTERREHLGGPLGTALTDGLFAVGWIARAEEPRVIRVTARGRRELAQLGVARDALD